MKKCDIDNDELEFYDNNTVLRGRLKKVVHIKHILMDNMLGCQVNFMEWLEY